MRRFLSLTLAGLLLLFVSAADWPLNGSDSGRSGYIAQELPATLVPHWTYHAAHAPRPAWPQSGRQDFDAAFHPVVAAGKLFFGSSADCKVHALDAVTGTECWTYFTGGPVRFAPAVWKDRLFVASDDGFLHCLSAADGKLLWQKRGGPDARLLLGNDRMVSRWPARGGPVVHDDTVYFAAGIWPSDGIYLHALEAATGKSRWVNDTSGSIYMPQPHGGANAHSGVSAQGYLVVAGDKLLVPTGRAVPAVFDRATGKFLYFHLQANGRRGGSSTVAAGPVFVNAGNLFETATGKWLEAIGPGVVAVCPEGVVRSATTTLSLSTIPAAPKKGPREKISRVWATTVPGGGAVLVAGKTIVAGGQARVRGVELASGKVAWSAPVEGTPRALAAANGRLYVSTDRGVIHCFGAARAEKPVEIRPRLQTSPYGENTQIAAAAKEIVDKAGVVEGYGVDLGCGDGALAFELARRTKLQIHAIEADPAKVALARRKLDAAGLYGVRVTVHQGDPVRGPFPRHFADLVVSSRSLAEGADKVLETEVNRVQRPFGGIACLGRTGTMAKSVRGALPGAGNWTHQYADPGNTCCSSDAVVKGPLSMLWFRDSDFDMPQRHGRGPAPLFLDGRLIVEGLNGIRAVDAYNGRPLWEHSLPGVLKAYHGEHLMGTSGTHGNYCVTPEGVYVRTGSKCLRLDVATGKELGAFEAPLRTDGKRGTWGYVACEKGILFGSLANEDHVVRPTYRAADMRQLHTESAAFFALDARTGKHLWTFTPRHSIRHNAIAIGAGRVHLIDRPLAGDDRLPKPKKKATKKIDHPTGELVALEAATGKVVWKTARDVYGTLLTLSTRHGVLVMGYQPTAFRLPSEEGGRLTAYRAADGKALWHEKASYSTRPLINDRTIYASVGKQGGAWDLLTGESRRLGLNRSYGCGQLAGGAHLMVFRSATLGYVDLLGGKETASFGGMRPGCWINAIPAGGVVLVPDASAGCECSYLNKAWIALQGSE